MILSAVLCKYFLAVFCSGQRGPPFFPGTAGFVLNLWIIQVSVGSKPFLFRFSLLRVCDSTICALAPGAEVDKDDKYEI